MFLLSNVESSCSTVSTCVVYLRTASQCRLQQVPVLPHPDGEVPVAFVNRRNTTTELSAVGVAFSQHALGQLY